MQILVTGGAGFIGSNFIYYLQQKYPGYAITCLDALTYAGNYQTLSRALLAPNFTFVRGDIAEGEFINDLFSNASFDIVVNFAAESHVDRSLTDPSLFIKTNVLGTQILLDACRRYQVARFHQVSTDEVYGDLPLDRPELLFTEETPLHASSPYSASKAAADLLTLAYFRTFNLPVSISRCSNNYGPFHFPEKLIPLILTRALSDKKLPVYGAGANIRDWLYVEDHCSAIDLIIHHGQPGAVYNIGGHNEYTNLDVVKIILRELNKSDDLIEFVTDRPGHDLRYAIDPAKIMRELGWKPTTSFADGIRVTIAWYVNHSDWWQQILSGEYCHYYEMMSSGR